jgi:hypothetical protein
VVLAPKAVFIALVLAGTLTSCGPRGDTPAVDQSGTSSDSSTPSASDDPYADDDGTGSMGGSPGASPRPSKAPPKTSAGWTVTVYYTAVAKFHDGDPEKVKGCPSITCSKGDNDLGTYPSDFVKAVKDEGAGKIADGKYLNWSYDTGYWLDTAARDTAGRPLRPFMTAAADAKVLRSGTKFGIVQCGRDDDGDAIGAAVCAKLKSARWTIADEFTPGLGGEKHVDVYIGEETQKDFTDTDWYTTLHNASLAVG